MNTPLTTDPKAPWPKRLVGAMEKPMQNTPGALRWIWWILALMLFLGSHAVMYLVTTEEGWERWKRSV